MVPLLWVACACSVAAVAPKADASPLVLGGGLADDAALRSELALRLPDHALVSPEDRGALPSGFLWIEAAPREGALELQVITSDGRLYRRTVPLPAQGDAARITAGAVANLVDGIAQRTLTPDAVDVAAISHQHPSTIHPEHQ